MRKDLVRRLEKLESARPKFDIRAVVWLNPIEDRDRVLAENERIVEDWYVDGDDLIIKMEQRITNDPSDTGRNYKSDPAGREFDDPGLERKRMTVGRARLICVVRKSGRRTPLYARFV